MQKEVYIGRNCFQIWVFGSFLEKDDNAIVSGGDMGEVGTQSLSYEALDAVAIDGARRGLLTDDDGKAAFFE
ncbi:MAG: hypothetical protein WAU31_03835 [Candidatus Moraniibacteriota bacterium]